MPIIKDAEKTQIKSRARRYVQDLWDAPLSSGFELYDETISKLHDRSSRLRICLRCGTIDKKESLTTSNHHCAFGIDKISVIILTNWVILKNFFLTDEYTKALQKLGVEPVPEESRPSKTIKQIDKTIVETTK
ncbi:MAG: hypothetical protein E3J43_08525 [Candidatus Heimdallarchaeota archaeon]|nr:MAG: hypothetical protein E3J43_08525 [Candidatus Heimdallarchaeota archaeon]